MPSAQGRRTPLVLLLVLPLAAGCLGAGGGRSALGGERPYVPLPDAEPESVGFFLAQFDKSLARWTDLKLSASKPRELRQLHALERSLQKRASERFEELLVVLESGAPLNRQVAAVALGFSGDERALSPLLSALSDRDPLVPQKALLGLGLLGRPETPTSQITYLLENHPDPWTRNNAAYALQCIVSAGARSDDLAASCRDALIDEEPGVRAQCASVLGILQDAHAVQSLGDLLYDDVNLVSAAAATSLARIGRFQLEKKGAVARQLVDALEQLEPARRSKVVRELVWMSDKNFEEVEDWREWAYRLP